MAAIVVAVMVMVCGRHGLWLSLFVAVIAVAVIANFVAVMVCGRHCRTPKRWKILNQNSIYSMPYTV